MLIACMLIMHMGAKYMSVVCVYECYLHCTCILIVYMSARYMYIDCVHGCYIHVY